MILLVVLSFIFGSIAHTSYVYASDDVILPRSFIKYTEFPSQGVLLGQGWNSFTNQPVAATCIKFDESMKEGHDISVKVDEIRTRYQLNKRLKVSASASYRGFGVKVGGSASYSNSLDIDQSKSNILTTIEVDKGDSFVSPIRFESDKDAVEYKAISLTKDASEVIRKSILNFRRMCGNSFIAHIDKGASLRAMINVTGLSSKMAKGWTASLSGSGYGAKMSASVTTSINNSLNEDNVSMAFHQIGGPLSPIAFNIAEYTKAVSSFLTEPSGIYPVNALAVGYMSYEHLSGWPSSEKNANLDSIDALMTLYFLYDDLHRQYLGAVRDPGDYVFTDLADVRAADHVLGFNGPTLCHYKGAVVDSEINTPQYFNGTALVNDADSGNDAYKTQCPPHREYIVSTTYFLESMLEREQTIKDTLGILGVLIDHCVLKGANNPDKCLKSAVQDLQNKVVDYVQTKELVKNPNDAIPHAATILNLANQCENDCLIVLALLDETQSDSDLIAQFENFFQLDVNTAAGLVPDDLREAIKHANTQVFESLITPNPYLSVLFQKHDSYEEFLDQQLKAYHYLLMKAPLPRIKCDEGASNSNVQCVNYSNKRVIDKNTSLSYLTRSKNRRESVLQIALDINVSLCKDLANDYLCLDVSALRKIADDADLMPTIGVEIEEKRRIERWQTCKDVWDYVGPLVDQLSRDDFVDRGRRVRRRVCDNHARAIVSHKLTAAIIQSRGSL